MTIHRSFLVVPVSFALLLAACGSSQPANPTPTPSESSSSSEAAAFSSISNPTPAPAASSQAAQNVSVTIQNFAFAPAAITVKAGTTVTWTNNDTAPHTVTGDTSGPGSPQIAPGGTYSYTFTTAGTFPYHCSIHPNMRAAVTVQ
jgi:plastocyanin